MSTPTPTPADYSHPDRPGAAQALADAQRRVVAASNSAHSRMVAILAGGHHRTSRIRPGEETVPGIPSDQVMAIIRLKQWAVERTALKCGRSTRLTSVGWRERRETDADARNVRVMDFEKALATLDTAHQYALVLTYRDRVGHAATAAAIGCRLRTLAYMLPAARRRLVDALDRRDLL